MQGCGGGVKQGDGGSIGAQQGAPHGAAHAPQLSNNRRRPGQNRHASEESGTSEISIRTAKAQRLPDMVLPHQFAGGSPGEATKCRGRTNGITGGIGRLAGIRPAVQTGTIGTFGMSAARPFQLRYFDAPTRREMPRRAARSPRPADG